MGLNKGMHRKATVLLKCGLKAQEDRNEQADVLQKGLPLKFQSPSPLRRLPLPVPFPSWGGMGTWPSMASGRKVAGRGGGWRARKG